MIEENGGAKGNDDLLPQDANEMFHEHFWTDGKNRKVLFIEVPVNCSDINWLEQLTDSPPNTWRQGLQYVTHDGCRDREVSLYGDKFLGMGFDIDDLEIVGILTTTHSGYSVDFDLAVIIDDEKFSRLMLKQMAKYVVLLGRNLK